MTDRHGSLIFSQSTCTDSNRPPSLRLRIIAYGEREVARRIPAGQRRCFQTACLGSHTDCQRTITGGTVIIIVFITAVALHGEEMNFRSISGSFYRFQLCHIDGVGIFFPCRHVGDLAGHFRISCRITDRHSGSR